MKKRFLLPLAFFAFASVASAQTVLYRETFSSTVNNANHSNVSWAVQRSGGTSYTNAGFDNVAGISSQTGRVTDLGNVNAGNTTNATINSGGQTSTGFFFINANLVNGSANPTLAWTNEAGPIAVSNVGKFSFDIGNVSTTQNVRVAIQVGSAWYVSSTAITSPAVSGAGLFASLAQPRELTFSTAAGSWNTITFQQAGTNPLTSAGTGSLSLGALATTDLAGDINAFGLYVESGADNVRFDTFTITSAIPEPSAYAVLAGLGALGLAVLRRRR
jgi:hypothetical protein